jgi:antitoxin CptB
LSKLQWRCRRGTKELDVLLQRYLLQGYAAATPSEQRAFEMLLDQPDPDLQDYFSGYTTHPDPETRNVIQAIVSAKPNP